MAPSLEISIPTTSTATSSDSKQYTLYAICLRQPLRSYKVQKRYSDFVELHAALKSQSTLPPPAALPKKSWIKSTVSSPYLTETRRKGLETYLRAINESKDPRWRQSDAWKQFLNLPNTGSSANEARYGTTTALGTRHADLEALEMDPSIWLDVHRDLKSQLAEARQALRRRDAAVSSQAQHDAGSEVKRWLVRSGTLIATLENALRAISSGTITTSNGSAKKEIGAQKEEIESPQLGEGEVRRRKDLLSAAKKEMDALEHQMNSYTSKNAAAGGSTEPATSSAEQKESLLSRPVNSVNNSNTNTSRRVLGAPIKETERTRELDNEGLLQLQQQVMREQEEDVGDLTKVVQRMKGMGLQINEELQLQNEMLGLLDKDVERVDDKVKIAKKRIGKIE